MVAGSEDRTLAPSRTAETARFGETPLTAAKVVSFFLKNNCVPCVRRKP